MCSVSEFLDMDNFQGDLTDIVRGSTGHVSPSGGPSHGSWEPQLQPQTPPPSDILSDFPSTGRNSFGDPFVNISDPLLQELNVVAASDYLAGGGGSVDGYNKSICSNSFVIPQLFEDDMKNQCNIFPRIRISQSNIIHDASPCNSPVMATHKVAAAAVVSSSPRGLIGKSPAAGNDVINVNTNSSLLNNSSLMDNNSSSQIQISSPRNLGQIKRRKSQAKKVVCIPAPAAANSRSSGEVVPSDLWAWRKYGQKPIKGSPFPRGYYRCSSSKGCSARKQVERSRANPNMLVITYTSEHNHPWPTQRNALAGSTRSSHSSKSNATSSSSRISSQSRIIAKLEDPNSDERPLSGCGGSVGVAAASTSTVKEEAHDEDHFHEEQKDMELDNHSHSDIVDDYKYSSYRPELVQPEDFFADLDELEGDDDPLSLLLSQGFVSGTGDGESKGKVATDLFDNIFDWSSAAVDHDDNHNNNDTTSTSFDDRDSSKSS